MSHKAAKARREQAEYTRGYESVEQGLWNQVMSTNLMCTVEVVKRALEAYEVAPDPYHIGAHQAYQDFLSRHVNGLPPVSADKMTH